MARPGEKEGSKDRAHQPEMLRKQPVGASDHERCGLDGGRHEAYGKHRKQEQEQVRRGKPCAAERDREQRPGEKRKRNEDEDG